MSGDDWSCVGLEEDEWTQVVAADDESSQWSILSGETKGTGQSSVVSRAKIPVRNSVSLLREIKEDEEEEEADDDSTVEEDSWRERCGKKALKHSLVRRSYATMCLGYKDLSSNNGYIESMPRRLDESGLSAKTVVDDLFPELMFIETATLGRAQRWSEVKALFQQLEQEGIAVRLASKFRQDHGYLHGTVSPIPHDIEHYVVKPNGTFKNTSRSYGRYMSSCRDDTVHLKQRGALRVWYELTSEPPSCIEAPPLCGSLRAGPNTRVLTGAARLAFSPGVATSCGAASTVASIYSAQRAVAEEAIDLVFGHSVSVTYASLAGKMHDTRLEKIGEAFEGRIVRKIHVALEGTEAYCDHVEISARLSSNPRKWVSLGTFDGCRDGHTEKPIFLGDYGPDGAVHCIALRFRALSWHNHPFLRVGAYGFDDGTRTKSQKFVHEDGVDLEDGVEYVLHYAKNRNDGNDGFRRKYGVKQGNWSEKNSRDPMHCKACKRSQINSTIKESMNENMG